MPFEDLETVTRHNQPPRATISYCVAQRNGKSKSEKQPKLTISIPTTICGTSKAKAFKLKIGTGASAGKLRIVGVPDKAKALAGVVPSQHAHFFRWNFGYVPLLGEDQFEGEKRPVIKVGEDEFEIDVPPSWFEAAK